MSSSANILRAITRKDLKRCYVRRLHEARSVAQANIELIEIGGHCFVLKDFYAHHPLVRAIWGRRIIAHEWRIYKRLAGIEGIPRIYKRLNDYAFIMEYVAGGRIPHRRDNDLTPKFFERLKRLVAEMHTRGITHGDLRRKNILVKPDEHPFLIDFASAFALKGHGNFITRALFRRLKKIDELTVLKLQAHLLPGTLTVDEERRLAHTPWYLSLGRFLKKKIYRPFKHATRKRKK